MTRSKPAVEGSTGLKFSEIIVIGMAIAGIVFGVRYYLDYRHSASASLQEFIGAVKAGNTANQYALLDQSDKKKYYPSTHDYETRNTLSHGYTERVESFTLSPEIKDSKNPEKVSIPVAISIRASGEGKQLYQTGQTLNYNDTFVMKKQADGNWRVVYSESIDKSTGKLHLQAATPSPSSLF